MGVTFKDLSDALDPVLRLPIKGTVYVIESPPAKLGIHVQKIFAAGAAAAVGGAPPDMQLLNDDDERDLFERLLGPAYQQMVDDGVRWHMIKHAGMTALFWTALGDDAAERFWENGNPGEAVAPNRAARRAKAAPAKKATARKSGAGAVKSTSTAAATTTRKRASGTTTNSPTTSRRAASASSGARSSKTGR